MIFVPLSLLDPIISWLKTVFSVLMFTIDGILGLWSLLWNTVNLFGGAAWWEWQTLPLMTFVPSFIFIAVLMLVLGRKFSGGD